ncbi:MAG: hypothetical protein ACQ9MH_27675, partial [Nitrospinales bacterium]
GFPLNCNKRIQGLNGETPQNVPIMLLTRHWVFCGELCSMLYVKNNALLKKLNSLIKRRHKIYLTGGWLNTT